MSISRSIVRPLQKSVTRSVIQGAVTDPLQELIQQLFGNGEQGAFYLPQTQVYGEQATFQNYRGSLSASSAGDPVGLVLDAKLGMEKGDNLFISGDSPNVSFRELAYAEGDVLKVPAGNGASRVDIALGGGTDRYLISFDFIDNVGAGALRLGIGWIGTFVALSGTGFKSFILEPNGEADFVNFGPLNGSGDDFEVSNLVIRSVPGSHAAQPTSTYRPIYTSNPDLLTFDGVDDSLEANVSILSGNVATASGAGVTVSSGIDMSSGYSISQSNKGVIILDRAFTPTEISYIESYFS